MNITPLLKKKWLEDTEQPKILYGCEKSNCNYYKNYSYYEAPQQNVNSGLCSTMDS